MFPGINGFKWDAGHIIFLGAFYLVVTVILATIIRSLVRARRHFRLQTAEAVQWKENFHDLPVRDRRCRHEINGTVPSRVCENTFDCRICNRHPDFESAAAGITAPVAGDLLGFPLPLDRLYHRGHTWVRVEEDGTLTVGLDELASRLIGRPERLRLPEVGSRVRANGMAWRADRNGSNVRILAPIDGTVIATGGPDEGWYLKLGPDTARPDMRHLLRGGEAIRWMIREMERLQIIASESRAPVLADGGVPVADVGAALPKTAWESVCGEMLLHP